MSNNHNFLALDWVKSEIEETLKQAQQALEAHISNPSDESQLRFCLAYLHQIFGTLQMVEFHGAAMLAEEMEKLCLSLVNGKVTDSRKAYDVLVKAMLNLPAYLERLQATKRDVPFVLLPIINTLRIAHDEIPLSEVSLFQPDFTRVYSIIGQEGEAPSVESLKKLRLLYQSGLVAVMRDADPHSGIAQLRHSVQLLSRMLSSKPLKSLWSVSDALLEGLEARSIPLSPAVKLLLGEIEREIRKFAAFPQHVPAEELLKNILYYIAKSQGRTAAIVETKALYRLDEALPTAEKIEADAQSLNAPDRSAVKSVVKSTADELTTIKETIDDLMYADRPEIRTLEPLLPALKQIAGTLTVMDWSDLQRIADEIHGVLSAAVRSGHLSEGTLLHVAAGILELEGGLQQLIDDQPLFESYAPSTTVADQLSAAQSAVLRESRTALEKAKEAIVEYISSQWNPERLAELPELINTVRGGLTMLDIVRPAQILSRLSEYIEKQLLTENYRPSWSEMDTMADVVSSVEYYLERVASHHQNNDLLELAERALQRLGFGLVLVMPETNPEALERAREQQAQRAQEVEQGPQEPQEIGDENTTLLNMPAVELSDMGVEDSEPAVAIDTNTEVFDEPALVSDTLEITGIHAAVAPIEVPVDEDSDRTLISMPALQIDILDESAPSEMLSAAKPEGFDTDKTLISMPALKIGMPGESESPSAADAQAEDDMGKTLVSMPALRLPDDMILADKTRELPAIQVGQASLPIGDDGDKTLISMPALVLPEDKASAIFTDSDDFNSTLTFDAETLLDGVEFLGAKKAPQVATDTTVVEAVLTQPTEETIVSLPVAVTEEEAITGQDSRDILAEEESFDAEATLAASTDVVDLTAAEAKEPEEPSARLIDELPAQATKRAPRPVFAAMPTDDFDQDDEIREIFIEEVEEVLETIHEYFPKWAANFENKAALTEFRRGFHTLKGSGRMVGAKVVGETAWAIENMLNRVIDHTARPSPAMCLLISSVLDMVPDLVRNFSEKQAPVYNPGYLMAVAEEFSRGHAVLEEQVQRAVSFARDPSLADRLAAEQIRAESVSQAASTPEDTIESGGKISEPVDVTESGEQEDLTDAFEALASSLEEIEPEAAVGVEDPVLMDIFTSEANSYLEEIDSFLNDHAGAGSVAVTDGILRALHTLRGSAGMAGVRLVASVAAPMETLFKDMRNQGRLLNVNHLALLREAHRIIQQSISSLMQGGDGSADGEEALLDRIDLVAKMPADHGEVVEAPALVNTAGLVAGFLDLGLDELMDAPWELSNWLAADDRADHIETLKQELGKLVPAARESGIDPLSMVANALVGIYSQILADDALLQNDAMLEVLGDAHDEIINIFDTLAACQTVAPNPRLIERLQQWYAPAAAIPASAAPAVVEYDDGADPELLAIFLEEGEEILEAADSEFRNWQSRPDDKNALRALQRHLHTLKGGARMAVVASLGDLAHELEFLYEGLVDGRYTASPVLIDLLQRCHDRLADMLTGLVKNGRCAFAPDLVEVISLYRHSPKDSVILDFFSSAAVGSTKAAVSPAPEVAPVAVQAQIPESKSGATAPVELSSATDAASAPSEVTSGFDPEMLEIFLEEAQEIVEETTRMLEEWMADPEVLEPVRILQRGLHTLKGGARMAGVTALGDIAHEMENLYEAAGLGRLKITPPGLSLLQRCHDSIAVAVEDLQEKGECPGFNDLVEALKRYLSNPAAYEDIVRAAAPKAVATSLSSPAPVQAPVAAPALNLTPVDLSGIPSMMGNFRKAESAQQAAQEMIRVSSELMEKLINLAGESSIIRSRVEMGVHGFAQTVEEMGATVQRLADQLRRMQGELEAQIIAQHTDDSTKYADFDPLEMDQYSSVNQLSKSLYESASDLMDIKVTLIEKARDTETLLLQQSRLNTELQEGLMSSRMVPFSRLVPRLQRIVRQTSQELHKPAELHVINAEGEMDRTLLERLVAPLEHMLRNAVDHGLENPEERAAAGKESMGRVSLSISREGGEVVLHLMDDGKGINVDAVRKKALERGLIEEGQTISDRELLQFIFHAGFSTAQKVTQISGRGVGMDVVQSEIKQLGGVVSIQSERGKGTTFVLRLPFTVAVSRALMVRIGEDVYAIPLSQIEGIVRASPYELETYYSPDAPPFEYAGLSYKLHYLGEFVHGVRTPSLFGQTLPLPILLVRGGEQRVSIQVDQLIGSREIVVKSVGAQLASVAGISGATILGDGSVVIILDVVAMLRAAAIQRPRVKTAEKGPEMVAAVPEKATKTVMVVDDSVTVRKVTSRLLERHGYDVVLAKDGLDAISKLEEIRPDIMLLDIEMPRMDGFEVASLVRHNPNLTGLPIIMITSRTGEKHRERAFQIGVNCYMGKPFQEQQLLDTIGELLAAPVAR